MDVPLSFSTKKALQKIMKNKGLIIDPIIIDGGALLISLYRSIDNEKVIVK
jgi:arsenate reductase-like glutaredoxin family protein